jgi:predicted N-acyltransferase
MRQAKGAPDADPARELSVEVCPALSGVEPAAWDRLLEPDDAPLLSWAYLQGLEETGCVGEPTGWLPFHLLVRRRPGAGARSATPASAPAGAEPEGELVAAAPLYLKAHSEAEWVYDFDWAEFAERQGIAYYPKLVSAVPFNPVTGGRLLARPDLPTEERQALRRVLLLGMKKLCQEAGLSSAHVLFPRGPRPGAGPESGSQPELETAILAEAGFTLRRQEQYHFLNEGYRDFEDFLLRMDGHRRSTIRRERRALREAGITVTTCRGLAPAGAPPGAPDHLDGKPPRFTRSDVDQVFAMYEDTSRRHIGEPPFLSRAFFQLCAERLGDRLELVLARDREGAIVGGALNLCGQRRGFGRFWGASQRIRFLHFEVCYYHPVERTIREGLEAFEPGHGGEQKLLRGFTPVYTYSAHYLRDLRLRRPIEAFLRHEAPLVDASVQAAMQRCPLRFGALPVSAATGPPREREQEQGGKKRS